MRKILIRILVFAGFLLFFIAVLLYIQEFLFFHPWHDEASYNVLKENSHFTELQIPHKDGTLHGWLRKNSHEEKAPLLLFFGGNGQNSSNTMQLFEAMDSFSYFENHHVLFVDYPGYGLSDGRPTETSLFSAALEFYDYGAQLDSVDPRRISVLGYSIGTGVANYVAAQRDVSGLLLLDPYDKGLSLYNDVCNIFHGPIKYLARFEFDSQSYATQISVSPLIITSRDDEVIPSRLSLSLGEAFPNTSEIIVLEGISHDSYLYYGQVMEAIASYLSALS